MEPVLDFDPKPAYRPGVAVVVFVLILSALVVAYATHRPVGEELLRWLLHLITHT